MTHRNERREAHEHKRGVASPRLVKLLGADARLAVNDEPETEIDRGPLTMPAELTDDQCQELDALFEDNKAVRYHQRNDAAAVEAQIVDFRARGLL